MENCRQQVRDNPSVVCLEEFASSGLATSMDLSSSFRCGSCAKQLCSCSCSGSSIPRGSAFSIAPLSTGLRCLSEVCLFDSG